MLELKPFSGLYYYNKFSKANNVSRLVKRAFNLDSSFSVNLGSSSDKDEFNFKVLRENCSFDLINAQFKNWLEDGVLTVSGLPAFYVCSISYKILDEVYESRGVFAAFKLQGNSKCEISFLENFDANSTKLALESLKHINLQTKPIFALYEDYDNEISNLLSSMCEGPCCEKAKNLNTVYKVWEVKDNDLINKLQENFKRIKKLYIVHGRDFYDAALSYGVDCKDSVYALTFFMDKSSNVLANLPVHRVISMNMFDFNDCLSKFNKYFDFFEVRSLSAMRSKMFSLKREEKAAFGIYAEEKFGVLVLKDDCKFLQELSNLHEDYRQSSNLDTFIANELIVKKLLNLNEADLQFTVSTKAAKEAIDNGDGCMALFLNSERMTRLFEILDDGGKLPAKTSFLFPNPLEGLVFYSMQ